MLRDELLAVCRESGGTVHEVVQGLIDALMISVIVIAPTVDDAERDIGNITECMRTNIRKSYGEYHDMAAAQRGPRPVGPCQKNSPAATPGRPPHHP